MLTNLHVKNLALIDEAEVDFTEGLNILTGETGAGKSIIIGAVNYCLGQKTTHDVIRSGAEYALVELVFSVNDMLKRKLSEMELPADEDSIILTRKIYPGKTTFKISGETVTAKTVKELASYLIDIHGQHEHQSLLSKKNQSSILDDYCGDDLLDIKNSIAALYKEYNDISKEIESLDIDESLRQREISLAEFEINEIEDAYLIPGEDEDLSAKHKRMLGSEKISKSLSSVSNNLKSGSDNALSYIDYALREISNVSNEDETARNIYDKIQSAGDILSEVCRDIDDYLTDCLFDEFEFDRITKRLDLINSLCLKYGGNVEKVNEYLEKRKKQLCELSDVEGTIKELRLIQDEKKNEILKLSQKAHDIREKVSEELSKEISGVLVELNFLKVNFEITVNKTDSFNADGFDDITFMISLNPGEKMMPIAEVASGGELSRIMLALKSVFAKKDMIGTLIFDEIDSGISGQTAWKVSKMMNEIAKNHQVISITHLPQIAAMADSHFKIEKDENAGKTATNVCLLDKDSSINELSRLLGGDEITDATRQNAIELVEKAKDVKAK